MGLVGGLIIMLLKSYQNQKWLQVKPIRVKGESVGPFSHISYFYLMDPQILNINNVTDMSVTNIFF